MRRTALLMVISLAAPVVPTAAARGEEGGGGPAGAMYITADAVEAKRFFRVRRDRIVASWVGVGRYEDLLAINDTIRTGTAAFDAEISAEYRLDGTDTGVRFSRGTPRAAMWDGTTDGEHNYAVVTPVGAVWRYDADWMNGEFIFGTGAQARGIAFDPTDRTFWFIAPHPTRLVHTTMSGEVLLSTPVPIDEEPTGIGLDHRDGTLWVATYTFGGTMYQLSKKGELLQTFTVPGVSPGVIFGVEFRLPPACAADMDRSGTLTLADFTAFRDAYVEGDLIADMNDDDALTLADFVEFRNAYLAGCP